MEASAATATPPKVLAAALEEGGAALEEGEGETIKTRFTQHTMLLVSSAWRAV